MRVGLFAAVALIAMASTKASTQVLKSLRPISMCPGMRRGVNRSTRFHHAKRLGHETC